LAAAGVKAGEPVTIAVNGASENAFTARVTDTRYQGTQTAYELELLGGRIVALELGTLVRHPVGSDISVVLPPDLCWAYPAGETTGSE
jgi:iron(III) transport system ATP-binding protein